MQDIEPPEAPIDLVSTETGTVQESTSSKKGFLKKLFSKKERDSVTSNADDNTTIPPFDMKSDNSNNNTDILPQLQDNIPTLPSLNDQLESEITAPEKKKTGKSKGRKQKGQSENISGFNESDRFDWNNLIALQEDIIKDNAKNIDTQITNKSKGKKPKDKKAEQPHVDETSNFDWERPIRQQEILIHDSNRSNQDINALISKADEHVAEKSLMTNNGVFLSEHQDINPSIEQMNIPDTHTELNVIINPETVQKQDNIIGEMPVVDAKEHQLFQKINASHQKIRSILGRSLQNKKFFDNKSRIKELLKAYDESIEKRIEDGETRLSQKSIKVESQRKQLRTQELGMKRLYAHVKNLDQKLKLREMKINQIISDTVGKEIIRRVGAEKKMLKNEITKTIQLNKTLKSRISSVEKDRTLMEKQYRTIMETERKKLNDMQQVYDKKIIELDKDRKEFEDRRNKALELLKKADGISRELSNIKQLKEFIEQNKKFIRKELSEDKELKRAIERGEVTLKKEKENLDNLVFSKYIEKKLKAIKPEYIETKQDMKIDLESNPLYDQIKQCRQVLGQGNIKTAKEEYNSIKRSFEYSRLQKKEREALYTAIRELYNDIQLKLIEVEMQ